MVAIGQVTVRNWHKNHSKPLRSCQRFCFKLSAVSKPLTELLGRKTQYVGGGVLVPPLPTGKAAFQPVVSCLSVAPKCCVCSRVTSKEWEASVPPSIVVHVVRPASRLLLVYPAAQEYAGCNVYGFCSVTLCVHSLLLPNSSHLLSFIATKHTFLYTATLTQNGRTLIKLSALVSDKTRHPWPCWQ